MKKETIVYLICLLIWGLFAFQFIRLGFIVPQVCDLDKEFLYCHLHPANVLAIIGMVLLGVSFIFVTGIWKIFTGEFITDKAMTYSAVAFAIGALGVGLIYAN